MICGGDEKTVLTLPAAGEDGPVEGEYRVFGTLGFPEGRIWMGNDYLNVSVSFTFTPVPAAPVPDPVPVMEPVETPAAEAVEAPAVEAA